MINALRPPCVCQPIGAVSLSGKYGSIYLVAIDRYFLA